MSRAGAGRKGSRRGFTLLEILIALSVLAVTMTTVYAVFSSGLRLRSATRERMLFDRDLRLLLEAMNDDFAHLAPVGPLPEVHPDRLVLLRTVADPGGETRSLALVSFQWATTDAGDSLLVRAETPLTVDASDSTAIAAEFGKWLPPPPETGRKRLPMHLEDPGYRFGDAVEMNSMRGAWLGYPEIRQFGFEVVAGEMEDESRAPGQRLRVRLWNAAHRDWEPTMGAYRPGAAAGGVEPDIQTVLWIPPVLYKPGSMTAGPLPGGAS